MKKIEIFCTMKEKYSGSDDMSSKRVQVANFNVVFLEEQEEAPLLKYLDTIVIPALKSDIRKVYKDASYLFTNIDVIKTKEDDYVLVGNIVKKTILEVKSDLDNNNRLIEKDEHYSAAPYSAFVIYLKNHRMIFVQNQKGSPNIKNFSSVIKFVLGEYIRKYNKEVINKELTLPFPFISIIGIPIRKNIKEALNEVKKINKLTLKFYPLNGDIDFSGMFGGLTNDLRKAANCKRGELVLRSPQSIDGVINIITQSEGTVEPIIEVTYPNKTKGKITEDAISESMEMEFSGDNIQDEILDVIAKGKKLRNIQYVSEGNEKIYDEYKEKIINLVPKN